MHHLQKVSGRYTDRQRLQARNERSPAGQVRFQDQPWIRHSRCMSPG